MEKATFLAVSSVSQYPNKASDLLFSCYIRLACVFYMPFFVSLLASVFYVPFFVSLCDKYWLECNTIITDLTNVLFSQGSQRFKKTEKGNNTILGYGLVGFL